MVESKLVVYKATAKTGNGNGDGNGYGDGEGNGDGNGYGDGYGYDDGYGDGNGYGDGYGYDDGYGDGNGNGYGDGEGNGYGEGYGYGYGYGDGEGTNVFVDSKTPIVAWWRVGDSNDRHMDKKLVPKVGQVHRWPYAVELCSSGLHACLDEKDTTKYRSGVLCQVACCGWMKFGDDKLVCSVRKILAVEE